MEVIYKKKPELLNAINDNKAYDIEGDLTLHGLTNKVKTKIYLASNGSKVAASGNFTVHAQDYAIEIPSLVKEKFAEQIKVSFNFDLDSK